MTPERRVRRNLDGMTATRVHTPLCHAAESPLDSVSHHD